MGYEVIEYFVESKDDAFGEQILAIEITDGEYAGTVLSYGKVDFPDPDEPILSFEYTIHKSDIDTTTEKFKNMLVSCWLIILCYSIYIFLEFEARYIRHYPTSLHKR